MAHANTHQLPVLYNNARQCLCAPFPGGLGGLVAGHTPLTGKKKKTKETDDRNNTPAACVLPSVRRLS